MNPQTTRVTWKANDIIRYKRTGHPYLVTHVFIDRCVDIIDLWCKDDPTPKLVITPRAYDQYCLDHDFQVIKDELVHAPLTL